MNSTIIGFEETLSFNQFYSADDLNEVFDEIARVLNNKLDTRDPTFNLIDLGGQRIINMAEGSEATDAITLGQLKQRAQLGVEFPTGLLPSATANNTVPLGVTREEFVFEEFTQEDLLPTLRRNIEAALKELSYKVKVGSNQPIARTANASGNYVTNVGKAIADTDAATFENALEIVNGTV